MRLSLNISPVYLRLSKAIIVLSALLTLCTSYANAQVTIDDERDEYTIHGNALFIEDANKQLDLEQVLALDGSSWKPGSEDAPNFGFTDSAYWFSLNLENASSQAQDLYFQVGYANLDSVEFFRVSDGQVLEHLHLGDQFSFYERPVKHPTFLFPFTLGEQAKERILLRVETSGSLQVPMALWKQNAFLIDSQTFLVMYGLFLGVLVVMSAYNFFLFLSIRDLSYFTYSIFTLSIAAVYVALDGYAYQWFWPNATLWNQNAAIVFTGISCTFVARKDVKLSS